MRLRVTAIHDVTIRAYMPTHEARQIGNSIVSIPKDRLAWVNIRAGESVVTGLVLGVDPRFAPQEFPMNLQGVPVARIGQYSQSTLPDEFFGLFRLEVAEE